MRARWRLDGEGARGAARVLGVAGVAGGYSACAVVGTLLSVPPSGFAIIWPATAFLIAVLLVAPPRRWWIWLAGVVPAHVLLMTRLGGDAPLVVMLSQVMGNIGLAAATALAVRAGPEALRFDGFRPVLRFIVIAGIAVPAVGNALILGLHLLTGWTETFWLSWRQWMLASIFPTLTIPPVLVLAFRRGGAGEGGFSRKTWTELAALCLALFSANYFAFGWGLDSDWWPAFALVSLPPLLWAAVRLSVAATSLALAAFAAAIIVQALQGHGPFAVGASSQSVLSLQVFLTALSIPLLLLAALTQERRRTQDLLRQSEARMRVVAASTETGLWQWDEATQQLWMTEYCRWMFGLGPRAAVAPEAFLDIVRDEDRAMVRAALRPASASDDPEAVCEFRVVRPDGEPRWLSVRTHAEFDRDGRLDRVSGVFRDITQRIEARQEVEELLEDERQRIAEELHESTAQNLVAVSLNLAALKRRIAPIGSAGSVMEEAFTSLNEARNELRTFTYLLRPAGLDREGVCAVLRRHAESFSRWTGLTATLRLSQDADRLPLEQQRVMLRVVQESLMNVHRHAAATRVSVRMRRVGPDLHLAIRDDGGGMRPLPRGRNGKPLPVGVGIPGMTAQVGRLGGRIAIRSGSRGTVVHVVLPMTEGWGRDAPLAAAASRR